jgi:hypothetical protein
LCIVSYEHGECFHQEITIMEIWHHGEWCPSTLADYCWALVMDAQTKYKYKSVATFQVSSICNFYFDIVVAASLNRSKLHFYSLKIHMRSFSNSVSKTTRSAHFCTCDKHIPFCYPVLPKLHALKQGWREGRNQLLKCDVLSMVYDL